MGENDRNLNFIVIKPYFLVLLFFIPITVSAQVPTDRVVDFINSQAISEGVSVSLALSIAKAESNFDTEAKNASSTASGIWEWLNKSFQHYCIDTFHIADSMSQKNDYHTSTICAIKTIKEYGTSPWNASKNSWSKLLDES